MLVILLKNDYYIFVNLRPFHHIRLNRSNQITDELQALQPILRIERVCLLFQNRKQHRHVQTSACSILYERDPSPTATIIDIFVHIQALSELMQDNNHLSDAYILYSKYLSMVATFGSYVQTLIDSNAMYDIETYDTQVMRVQELHTMLTNML